MIKYLLFTEIQILDLKIFIKINNPRYSVIFDLAFFAQLHPLSLFLGLFGSKPYFPPLHTPQDFLHFLSMNFGFFWHSPDVDQKSQSSSKSSHTSTPSPAKKTRGNIYIDVIIDKTKS